eukprot:872229-Ditylum_brightwellii.AAC.1
MAGIPNKDNTANIERTKLEIKITSCTTSTVWSAFSKGAIPNSGALHQAIPNGTQTHQTHQSKDQSTCPEQWTTRCTTSKFG